MIFRGKKPVTAFLAAAALVTAFIASGCSGTSNTSTTGWTLVGKVVDANSRAGVAGARVCVKINGDWNGHCAKTSTGATGGLTANAKPKYDATTTVGTTVGDFVITGLPYLANTTPVSVQAPAGSTYSDTTTAVNFGGPAGTPGASAGNANGQFDMGDIFIDKGVLVHVNVITATPAAPVNTNGAPIYWATNVNGDVVDVPATYVSGNQYTITLPRSGTGSPMPGALPGAGNFLVIPPFKSAGGAYFNGATTNIVWQDMTVEANPTINLVVTATTMNTPLALVASNFIGMSDNSPVTSAGVVGAGTPPITTYGITKDGVIKLYMNLPITLPTMTSTPACPTGEVCPVPNPYVIALSYIDSFKSLTKAASALTVTVNAAVDATDPALLTITPGSTLVENQTYSFAGRVQVATDWANQPGTNTDTSVPLDTVVAALPGGAATFYVYPAAATVAGNIGPIQIDNANGWTSFAAGARGATSAKMANETTNATSPGATKPYLLFPEMVWGTVRLIDYPGTLFEFAQHALTGTINYAGGGSVGGMQINGQGTKFDQELQVGDEFTDASALNVVWKVVSINSSTSLFATAWHNSSGTPLSSVNNVGVPGVTATVTLREGFYVNTVVAGGATLTGSQRVASSFVQDAKTGDVLSVAGQQYTVNSVSKQVAGAGLGRNLVVNIGSVVQTLTATATVVATGALAYSGQGYLEGDTGRLVVYGAWGAPAGDIQPGTVKPTIGVGGNSTVVAANGTMDTSLAAGFATAAGDSWNAAPVGANATLVAGAGYFQGDNSLGTGFSDTVCAGNYTPNGTLVALVATDVIGATAMTGCKPGDLVAIYNTTGTLQTTPSVIEITSVTPATGAPLTWAINTGTTVFTNAAGSTVGAGYTGGTAYTGHYLGTHYNVNSGTKAANGGLVFPAATGAAYVTGLTVTSAGTLADGTTSLTAGAGCAGTQTINIVSVTGGVVTAVDLTGVVAGTACKAGQQLQLTTGGTTAYVTITAVNVGGAATAVTLNYGGTGGYAAGGSATAASTFAATLGAVGSTVGAACGAASACISNGGSAGAMVGDLITVFNPNAGTPVGNGIAASATGLGASAGTILVTQVDPNSGKILQGTVVSPGAAYPVNTPQVAGVTTNFPNINANKAITMPTAPTYAATLTLGSRTVRGATGDLAKFGGVQIDALNDATYGVLATGGAPADLAALTYSIEYTNACGNAQAKAAGSGSAAVNLAALTGHMAYLQSVDTGNAFNIGGFDAAGFFGTAAAGPALVCDMTNVKMFGWAAGGLHAIAGPFSGGYAVSDSTNGTPMQIRLDVNIVDMAGNSLKATDTSYDVH